MVPSTFLEQWQQKAKANQWLHPPNNRPSIVLLVLIPSLQEEVWEDIKQHTIGKKGLLQNPFPLTEPYLSVQQVPKHLIQLSGQICLLFYLLTLYQHWHTTSQVQILLIQSMLYMKRSFHGESLFSIPSEQWQKSHTTTIRMVDSLQQQNLLSKDCSKSFMVIPALLMQKPSAKSVARDHTKILSQRFVIFSGKGRLLKVSSPQQKDLWRHQQDHFKTDATRENQCHIEVSWWVESRWYIAIITRCHRCVEGETPIIWTHPTWNTYTRIFAQQHWFHSLRCHRRIINP